MKTLLLGLILSFPLFATEFPARGYSDRTDSLMKQNERTGLEALMEKNIEGIQVKLYLAKSAQETIAKGKFLVPDPAYSQERLNAFIVEAFEKSLAYFRLINPAQEVKELHLVLVDKGGDVGTISEVPLHSRIVELHLVRWHKYLLRNSKSFVNVSSIHEFAHIVNYMYSPRETKFHREMTGVLTECLNLIQLYGIDSFTTTYLRNFTGKISDPNQITTNTYTNMNVIRTLAYVLLKNIYAGTYRAPLEPRKLSEEFVMNYLRNLIDDVAGFDAALRELAILDADGQQLTLKKLQEETKALLGFQ